MSATITMAVFTLILGVVVFVRQPGRFNEVAAFCADQARSMAFRIPLALLIATLLARLIPTSAIAPLIGNGSGLTGILIACALGGIVPGGPMVSFPLALVVWNMGAGEVQMVGFLAAWSIYAVHRVISYELPLMGPRFVVLRFLSSFLLPPLASLLAALVLWGTQGLLDQRFL